MLIAPIVASAGGATAVIAGVTGYKFRVIGFLLSFGGTVNVKFQSAANDLTGLIYGVAGTQAHSPALPATSPSTPPRQFVTNPGEALNVSLSTGVAVGGYVVYEQIAASM